MAEHEQKNIGNNNSEMMMWSMNLTFSLMNFWRKEQKTKELEQQKFHSHTAKQQKHEIAYSTMNEEHLKFDSTAKLRDTISWACREQIDAANGKLARALRATRNVS